MQSNFKYKLKYYLKNFPLKGPLCNTELAKDDIVKDHQFESLKGKAINNLTI